MPRILVQISQSSIPQQVTGSTTLFRNATFFGYSGFNSLGLPIGNAAQVNIGINSGELAMIIPQSGSSAYTIPTIQERDNFNHYWVMGQQNDGVYIIYN
jgi:hypothetical protein